MRTHIWAPLSMSLTSFSPSSPTIASSLSDACLRAPDGSILPSPDHFFRAATTFDSGGAGLFAAPSDYAKLLAAILRDDGTLLRPETLAMLFEPQLGPETQKTFDAAVYAEGAEVMSAGLSPEAKLTHGLGGAVCQADVEGRRRGGTLMWAEIGRASCRERVS